MFFPYAAILVFPPAPYLFCLLALAVQILGCIKGSWPAGWRRPASHLANSHQKRWFSSSALLLWDPSRVHTSCIRLWDPQHKKDMELLKQVHRRATKFIGVDLAVHPAPHMLWLGVQRTQWAQSRSLSSPGDGCAAGKLSQAPPCLPLLDTLFTQGL